MTCVFLRHIRESGLTPRDARTLHRLFGDDVRNGIWNLVPVSTAILDEVDDRLTRLRRRDLFLRAGDAVHLVSARHAGLKTIWTSDRHLLAAARRFGLRGRSVSVH